MYCNVLQLLYMLMNVYNLLRAPVIEQTSIPLLVQATHSVTCGLIFLASEAETVTVAGRSTRFAWSGV